MVMMPPSTSFGGCCRLRGRRCPSGAQPVGADIVDAAIQEDAQAIAVTSYQGGHMEFFRYLRDLLVERGCGHVRVFGGGGGTILPAEAAELMAYGITRIYSPDDGRSMGLQGMVDDMLMSADFPTGELDG
jgi:isobutyryl-CoA mutase